MEQQINLYQAAFRQQRTLLSMQALLEISGVVALGLILITAVGYWHGSGLVSDVEAMERVQVTAQARVDAMEEALTGQEESGKMDGAIQKAQQERDALARIYQALSEPRFENTRGFSSHLEGFSRRRIEGLWLTGFQFAEGGEFLRISGRTVAPENVPRFLLQLAQEPAFAGKEFQQMSIKRPEKAGGRFDFSVQTRLAMGETAE